MHNSTMFGNVPQQQQFQQQQPAVEIFDLQQIAPQFAGWNFGIGLNLDQSTGQICLMTINAIQQEALKGHPIRVGMFNFLSQNAFNNGDFQDLMQVIMTRIGHGIHSGEFRSIDMAVNTVVARGIKSYGSSLAAGDPEFMATMDQPTQAAVRENAEVWAYLVALAQGQAQYIPFNQMGGSGFSSTSGSTQEALAAARALRGGNAGGFSEAADFSGPQSSQHNNNGGVAQGRYGRRAEMIMGKLPGAIQGALSELKETSTPAAPYQSRLAAKSPHFTRSASDVATFDNNLTDFSKPLTPEPTVAKEPEVLFTVELGGEQFPIVRERTEGYDAWKSSRIQRYHPAWCTRTHAVRYFETATGIVLAVLQDLTPEQKEIAMDYEAHAIDPTKGQPDPEVEKKPVRPEAAVMYTAEKASKINVVIHQAFGQEETAESAILQTKVTASAHPDAPHAFIKNSLVYTPMVFDTAEEAEADFAIIQRISNARSFTEAAVLLGRLQNEQARGLLNQTLTNAVNNATTCELGVRMRISDFATDASEILKTAEDNFGDLIADKLSNRQPSLLQANICISKGAELKDYADATLTEENEEEIAPAFLERILFLQRKVSVAWVKFTDNELAIGFPPKGPAVIQGISLGGLSAVSEKLFNTAQADFLYAEQYLVTKDDKVYTMHRGLINPECYLLNK